MDSLLAGDHADRATGATIESLADIDRGCQLPLPSGPPAVWAPLPCGWVLGGGLKPFRGDPSHAGRSIAALKLFLTLTLLAGGAPIARAAEPAESVLVSYEELASIAGLSRPLIASARKMLCGQGLIRVTYEGQGGRVRYHLAGSNATRGRIHHALAPGDGDASTIASFRKLSCRDVRNLHALKLYVLMSGLRVKGQQEVMLDRAEIEGLTNLRESQAVAAFTVLRKHGLAAVDARALRHQAKRFAVTVHPLS